MGPVYDSPVSDSLWWVPDIYYRIKNEYFLKISTCCGKWTNMMKDVIWIIGTGDKILRFYQSFRECLSCDNHLVLRRHNCVIGVTIIRYMTEPRNNQAQWRVCFPMVSFTDLAQHVNSSGSSTSFYHKNLFWQDLIMSFKGGCWRYVNDQTINN